LVVLLDVSKSMSAQDAALTGGQIDSRFAAAKQLVSGAIRLLEGWKVGLVVFAGEPMLLCPMTEDTQALLTLLERARPGDRTIPQGTDIQQALQESIPLFGSQPGAILLLSDGEELSGTARDAIGLLRRGRITVYTVGFGRRQGTPLFNPDGSTLLWRNQPVVSALHDDLLRTLAKGTGGTSFEGESATALAIVSALHPAGPPTLLGGTRRGLPMVVALVLLLAEAMLSWRPWRSAGPGPRALLRPLPAMSLPIVALLCLGWTWPSWVDTWQGVEALHSGRVQQGGALLERALEEDPDNPVIRYDLANAEVASGRRRPAIADYQAALGRLAPRSELAERTWYNLGNAWFEQGRITVAARCYRKALAIDRGDADAKHNLALCQPPRAVPHRAPGRQLASAIAPSPPPDSGRLLQALELDERQRQAAAAQQEAPGGEADDPARIARQLLRQAGAAAGIAASKDW
ncbi:MAG: VWA domain-containing protein, partial [Cyanobacteria bacterium REEB65]|nr:VWA domain-containing protein [Cyanobacteria bacterium REEB65]